MTQQAVTMPVERTKRTKQKQQTKCTKQTKTKPKQQNKTNKSQRQYERMVSWGVRIWQEIYKDWNADEAKTQRDHKNAIPNAVSKRSNTTLRKLRVPPARSRGPQQTVNQEEGNREPPCRDTSWRKICKERREVFYFWYSPLFPFGACRADPEVPFLSSSYFPFLGF